MKLAPFNDVNLLKDSALTTQSKTDIINLKPKKRKIRIFSMKNVCVLYFSQLQFNS